MSFKADKAALVPTPAPSRLLRTTRVCRLHPKDGTCRMSIYLRTVRLVLMSTSSTLSRQGHLAQAQESPSHHFLGLLLQYVPFPQAANTCTFFLIHYVSAAQIRDIRYRAQHGPFVR